MAPELRSTDARLQQLEQVVADLGTKLDTLQAETAEALKAILAKLSLEDQNSKDDGSDEEKSSSDEPPNFPLVTQKMDLPTFEGVDVLSWLARAEQFFLVHKIVPTQKVEMALIAMSGPAMSWMQLLLRRRPKLDWATFTEELTGRFGDEFTINIHEALVTTKQTDALEDYIALFEGRVSQLPTCSDEQYLGYFLGGLKQTLRSQIQDSTIPTFSAAIQVARKLEAAARPTPHPPRVTHNVVSNSTMESRTTSSHRMNSATSPNSNNSSAAAPTNPVGLQAATGSHNRGNFRRVSDEEYWKHRAAGTCFRCGLKFGPTHRCPPKTLQVLIGDEEEEGDEDGADVIKSVEEDIHQSYFPP